VNLGVRIFQTDEIGDEREVTTAVIDTALAGEHVIIYRVINADGIVLAEAIRTVVVAASVPVNDNNPDSIDEPTPEDAAPESEPTSEEAVILDEAA